MKMSRERWTDERGQVGIGTLIVFIALVLVAAVAAGVLINTAGFLQTQGEQTGEDAADQVANTIIIGEIGDVGSSEDDVKLTRLTIQRSPGAGNIDLTELSIQYVGDNGFANYVYNGTEDDPDNGYYVETITAESGNDAVMTEDSDRYQIVIPFAEAEGSDVDDVNNNELEDDDDIAPDSDIDNLETSEEADIQITTADRATRNTFIQAPDTIDGEEDDTITL